MDHAHSTTTRPQAKFFMESISHRHPMIFCFTICLPVNTLIFHIFSNGSLRSVHCFKRFFATDSLDNLQMYPKDNAQVLRAAPLFLGSCYCSFNFSVALMKYLTKNSIMNGFIWMVLPGHIKSLRELGKNSGYQMEGKI